MKGRGGIPKLCDKCKRSKSTGRKQNQPGQREKVEKWKKAVQDGTANALCDQILGRVKEGDIPMSLADDIISAPLRSRPARTRRLERVSRSHPTQTGALLPGHGAVGLGRAEGDTHQDQERTEETRGVTEQAA